MTAFEQNKAVIECIVSSAESRIKHMTGMDVQLTINNPEIIPVHSVEANALVEQLCAIWGITSGDLRRKTNIQSIATMRKVAGAYLKLKVYKISFLRIAVLVGTTHHTSAMNAIETFHELLSVNDPVLLRYYEPVKHLFSHDN